MQNSTRDLNAWKQIQERARASSAKKVFNALDIGIGDREKLERVQQYFKRGKLKQSKASRLRVLLMEHYLEGTNDLLDAVASRKPSSVITDPDGFTVIADRLRLLEFNLYRIMWKVLDVTTKHKVPELVLLTADLSNQPSLFITKLTVQISTNKLKVRESLEGDAKRQVVGNLETFLEAADGDEASAETIEMATTLPGADIRRASLAGRGLQVSANPRARCERKQTSLPKARRRTR